MSGLLLHLSAPLQSWGGPLGGRVHGTQPYPTRSGLLGMLAAAQGRPRGADLTDLHQLSLTIRVDRPGFQQRDWHTIGGGLPPEKTVMTASGARRKAAVLREDWYMADAAYTLALTGLQETVDAVASALAHPVFPPHLGRRSCPPDSPILVAAPAEAEVALDLLPIHRPRSRREDEPVDLLFVYDRPPVGGNQPPTRELQDAPAPDRYRSWASRPVWEIGRTLPGALCAGVGASWITALADYRTSLAI